MCGGGSTIFDDIKDTAEDVVDTATDVVDDVADTARGVIDDAIDSGGDVDLPETPDIQDITTPIVELPGTVIDSGTTVIDDVGDAVAGVTEDVTDIVDDLPSTGVGMVNPDINPLPAARIVARLDRGQFGGLLNEHALI